MRGASEDFTRLIHLKRITPACGSMLLTPRYCATARPPRMRGASPEGGSGVDHPRMRGARVRTTVIDGQPWDHPAHAGSILRCLCPAKPAGSPRMGA